MRLSRQEGAQVYSNLRARSAGMRAAMLNAELAAEANEIGGTHVHPDEHPRCHLLAPC